MAEKGMNFNGQTSLAAALDFTECRYLLEIMQVLQEFRGLSLSLCCFPSLSYSIL